ncbi:MAG: polyprenyl diphosphate synthase [Elusimicrobiota bacterium]
MSNHFIQTVPDHIAIVMDGNSRWAKIRGYDVLLGHKEGAERVKDVSRYCGDTGVNYLSLFAFSTENWQRSGREVNALMDLLVDFLYDQLDDMNENNIRLLTSGRRRNFSKKVIKALDNAIEKTGSNTGLRLILCLDYGGRREIVDASEKTGGIITEEEDFQKHLYLPDVPDVDLLIRTSGEERLSNFMLWQLSYSELYFTPVLWPDFDKQEFDRALRSFSRRQRRFGVRI